MPPQRFHVVSDQAIQKHHCFRTADDDPSACREIDQACAAVADGGVFTKAVTHFVVIHLALRSYRSKMFIALLHLSKTLVPLGAK